MKPWYILGQGQQPAGRIGVALLTIRGHSGVDVHKAAYNLSVQDDPLFLKQVSKTSKNKSRTAWMKIHTACSLVIGEGGLDLRNAT